MKWSLSAKALAALPLASVAGWTGVVAYTRESANHPARGYSFNTGSMDDILSDTLQTGDIVLFRRNCAYMQPADAVSCFLGDRVPIWQGPYNHCGFIYVNHIGDKFVVEETYSGVKCRPYSARIITSLSTDIAVVPLRVKRTPEMQMAVRDFVEEHVNRPSRFSIKTVLDQFISNNDKPSSTPVFPAAGLIAEVYQRMGLLPSESTNGQFPSPKHCTITHWTNYSTVKLLQGAHFDRKLPIRLL
ncbi:hypothetical protein H257_17081 [Aphanomyces astaci]|uniref:LRAT domain-containing protein n=1 Tax=Aphanomyces astaci TaxID=112090 RepID=W4FI40_APHAT|nr:hypothetical protein H257_17081 [Aphanomyces astaci]ETV66519.1 hypothetical protein H257_17081 [Aphanomyces astaci]|eukprot:XP_009844048.1 hypothetical protein H257_17081 [Aphanomyces astaci]